MKHVKEAGLAVMHRRPQELVEYELGTGLGVKVMVMIFFFEIALLTLWMFHMLNVPELLMYKNNLQESSSPDNEFQSQIMQNNSSDVRKAGNLLLLLEASETASCLKLMSFYLLVFQ
ncbi:hypothetical protein NC651_033497 [Populus alba x Populus x berolinensis]|nr:hypothetical protein NC651_033497 [Populus alba x Populus x berolinensis]